MARRTNIRRKSYPTSISRILVGRPVGGQQAGLDEFDLAAGREAQAMKKMPRRIKKSDTTI